MELLAVLKTNFCFLIQIKENTLKQTQLGNYLINTNLDTSKKLIFFLLLINQILK